MLPMVLLSQRGDFMRSKLSTNRTAVIVITVLLALVIIGFAASTALAASFPDVPSTSPYYTAVNALAADHVIGGYSSGNFVPDGLVTREQFAKMIVLTMGLEVRESDYPNPLVPFVDLGPDDPASLYPHEYIAVATVNGLIKGTDATHFNPLAPITLSQVVAIVQRAGGSGSLQSGWDQYAFATRGQVAVMLYNLQTELRQGATTTTTPKVEQLTVSAASSLKAVFTEIGAAFDKANNSKTSFNFDASGTLQKQIEAGASVDVFASAALKQMNTLTGESLVEKSSVKHFASNEIALVVPANSTLGLTSFLSLTSPSVKKVGYGDPAVAPHGVAAEEVMKTLGIYNAVKPKVVYAANVSQATQWVISGQVDAGIVFVTEAYSAGDKMKIIATAKPSWHSPIIYPIGVLTQSKHQTLAQKFVDFVAGPDGQAILQKYGFLKTS